MDFKGTLYTFAYLTSGTNYSAISQNTEPLLVTRLYEKNCYNEQTRSYTVSIVN